jgi:hypothetical protein
MKTIIDFYDSYKASEDYLNETLEILSRLTGNKIDLPDLGCTLNKMTGEMINLHKAASKAFELCGVNIPKKEEAAA